MIDLATWTKLHKFQKKPGWCGPAVLQMVFAAAGIRKTQRELAKAVYKEWWGSHTALMFAYLTRFFKTVNYKANGTFSDIEEHLAAGHIVIVDWWDNLDVNGGESGHYSIVIDYKKSKGILTLADPTNERKGIWEISTKEFNPRWYDTLDVHGKKWTDGWMLWVDPDSKIDETGKTLQEK
ncbi:MAG: C39 family peptidase [Patescibacteria group bacterium]